MAALQQISPWKLWVEVLVLPLSANPQSDASRLIKNMTSYLDAMQSTNLRVQFFACRLRSCMEDLVAQASKVELYFRCLQLAIKDLRRPFQPVTSFSPEINSDLSNAIEKNHRQSLLWFSESLYFLQKGQVLELFQWASEKWDSEILCNLLMHSNQIPVNDLIDKALKFSQSSDVIDLIMLHRYDVLTDTSWKSIQTWIEQAQMPPLQYIAI